jgi:cell division protein FtsW
MEEKMSSNSAAKVNSRKSRNARNKKEYFFDYSLLFIVLFLLGFGLVMVYSASSYEALQAYGDAKYYFKRQLIADVVGVIAMIVVARIPYKLWDRVSALAYLFAMFLILLIIPFGNGTRGAKRWIAIPGTGFNIQPAEVAKLCLILFLATIMCKVSKNKIKSLKGFIILMMVPMPLVVMIKVITNNLSSALIIFGIALLMVFVASPDYKKFVIMGLIGVAAVAALVILIVNMDSVEGFRSARIVAWLDPESMAQDTGFQTVQGLYAIGSGGIWGKGLGQSMQKLSFLPEAQNDMIFSIICEELGLFGAFAVIVMFIMLLWRMMVIANNAEDLFGALLVVGVMGHIAIQAVLNIAVVTATIPNTGVSLPFISYGGSSVIFLLIEVGIVLSVAGRIQLRT